MNVLAIDTVTESCSAALLVNGNVLQREEVSGNRHSTLILGMIEDLLGEAGMAVSSVDLLAFDRGPGSFTGVRIGAGVAQGLAFAADLPVIGVSSLWTLAASCEHANVLAAIDARMGQVYWALVRGNSTDAGNLEEFLDDPAGVTVELDEVHGIGSGWDAYGAVMENAARLPVKWTSGAHPRAEWVARLAADSDRAGGVVAAPEAALPVYLRNRVVS
jgi:tRNA threonylcarbamoyladenosine biosynthesis protein TsaB